MKHGDWITWAAGIVAQRGATSVKQFCMYAGRKAGKGMKESRAVAVLSLAARKGLIAKVAANPVRYAILANDNCAARQQIASAT